MLFGRVLITKALGSFIPIQILKFLIDTIAGTLKKEVVQFSQARCSILRAGTLFKAVHFYMRTKLRIKLNYRDLEKVGLRMTDVDVMFKALGLARILNRAKPLF